MPNDTVRHSLIMLDIHQPLRILAVIRAECLLAPRIRLATSPSPLVAYRDQWIWDARLKKIPMHAGKILATVQTI